MLNVSMTPNLIAPAIVSIPCVRHATGWYLRGPTVVLHVVRMVLKLELFHVPARLDQHAKHPNVTMDSPLSRLLTAHELNVPLTHGT